MSTVHISITEDVERILESLKQEYPALNYSELFKLGLGELYRKCTLETRRRWLEDLPLMELSEEEAASIAEGRREIERGEGHKVIAEELMAELLSD